MIPTEINVFSSVVVYPSDIPRGTTEVRSPHQYISQFLINSVPYNSSQQREAVQERPAHYKPTLQLSSPNDFLLPPELEMFRGINHTEC